MTRASAPESMQASATSVRFAAAGVSFTAIGFEVTERTAFTADWAV